MKIKALAIWSEDVGVGDHGLKTETWMLSLPDHAPRDHVVKNLRALADKFEAMPEDTMITTRSA